MIRDEKTATQTRTAYEKILAEHEELRRILDGLLEFLHLPRPDLGAEEAHPWAESLARRLLDLHDKLYPHFREEEEGGMMQELKRRFPWACTAVERLQGEHKTLLGDLRQLLSASTRYAEGESPRDPRLRQRVQRLIAQLHDHEQAETRLLLQLQGDDLGAGD